MTRRNRALFLYVAVAYGITWSVWLPYLHAASVGAPLPNPFLYYFAAAGPLLAAVVAEWYERGVAGVSDLFVGLVDVRRARGWVFIGLLSPLLLVPVAAIVLHLAGQGWPVWSRIGVTGRAPGLTPLVTWLLMTLSYGIGEEAGWRGFLLPRLQTHRTALVATLILTAVWGGWHLPAFWFREGYVGLGATGIIGFAIGLTAGAIVLTALYNVSRGSILVVALWHGSWNWVATSDGLQGPWVAAMTAVIMFSAPLLIWWWGARDLSPHGRPVVPTTSNGARSGPERNHR
jgi:membrane protease YdiL (CAAX protease family)